MARLRISGLHKYYDTVHAVRGIDLDIREGEFTVLVGPSGCGKSTMLRAIAGLEEIDGGTIEIDDQIVNDLPPRDRDVAMVFQNYALYPYMNVFDNIAFGLRARKFPANEIAARVRAAAETLDIADLLERLPRQLSGGQRQRVAIGRAIVRDARLFLFDEPLSNLDAQLREGMRLEIKQLHQRLGKTMVYVTHDQIEAMTLADRIVLLRDGSIEQEGAPLELFERPVNRFVAGFLGSPSMNFLPATLVENDSALALHFEGDVTLALPKSAQRRLGPRAGQAVTFGVRTEHITRLSNGGAEDGFAPLSATIEVIQPTGSRIYATFRLGGVAVMAELHAHDVDQPGERIDLQVDMNRAIVIDSATDLVI